MEDLNALVCEALLAKAQQLLGQHSSDGRVGAAEARVEAAAARDLQASHAALDSVREEAATVGRQLLPLRSPAALATLLQAELLYPFGTPQRSHVVLEELRTRGIDVPSECELELLLSRLHASDDWKGALRSMTVPGEQRCVLVPPVNECVVCGNTQLTHARHGRSSARTVYSCRGKLSGELCGKECNRADCCAVQDLIDFEALRAKGTKGAQHARNAMTLEQLFPPSHSPSLDQSEPRLEVELGSADNVMAVASAGGPSSSAEGELDFDAFVASAQAGAPAGD